MWLATLPLLQLALTTFATPVHHLTDESLALQIDHTADVPLPTPSHHSTGEPLPTPTDHSVYKILPLVPDHHLPPCFHIDYYKFEVEKHHTDLPGGRDAVTETEILQVLDKECLHRCRKDPACVTREAMRQGGINFCLFFNHTKLTDKSDCPFNATNQGFPDSSSARKSVLSRMLARITAPNQFKNHSLTLRPFNKNNTNDIDILSTIPPYHNGTHPEPTTHWSKPRDEQEHPVWENETFCGIPLSHRIIPPIHSNRWTRPQGNMEGNATEYTFYVNDSMICTDCRPMVKVLNHCFWAEDYCKGQPMADAIPGLVFECMDDLLMKQWWVWSPDHIRELWNNWIPIDHWMTWKEVERVFRIWGKEGNLRQSDIERNIDMYYYLYWARGPEVVYDWSKIDWSWK